MSHMRWLLEQPDDILSQHETNKQFLCAEYTCLHPRLIDQSYLEDFIRRFLTRDLDIYAPAVVEEIEYALNATWGADTTRWVDIDLYPIMLNVIGRLVNRVLVGVPLSRDASYLRASTRFAQTVVLTAALINLLPAPLKPLFGPLITLYDKFQYRALEKHIAPIVAERFATYGPETVTGKHDPSLPNDYVQWALRDAFTAADPAEHTPEMISKRLAVLGFAAIQSSAITITNALVDIAGHPRSFEVQAALREEAAEVQATANEGGGTWTRVLLGRMPRVDGVLRESLRLWGFVSHGVTKVVVAEGGVELPSGERLPKGAKCGMLHYLFSCLSSSLLALRFPIFKGNLNSLFLTK
jgi:hypothetical protein